MLTDAELDALARDIITEAIAYIRRVGNPGFTAVRESGVSGPIITYVTNTQGDGDVLCEFAPLHAVQKIIRNAEGFCETFVVEVKDPATWKIIDRVNLPVESQPRSVENLAANATVRLIANFRVRIEDTLDEAIKDCSLIGAGWLASVEGKRLSKLLK